MKQQKGFTLVELAIVLVIIGIILGAVLKGQELIKNAKAKRVQNDMKGIEAVIWTFYDRYGRMPGDCEIDGLIDATVAVDPGQIDNAPDTGFCTNPGPVNVGTADTDLDRPWAELKHVNLLSRDDNRLLTDTPFEGRIYIGIANAGAGTITRNAIAVVDIPCFVAKMIDVSIDNTADAGVGRIRLLSNNGEASNTSDPNWANACQNGEEQLVDMVYFFDREP